MITPVVIRDEESFEPAMNAIRGAFVGPSPIAKYVNTGHWQALHGTPHAKTYELQNLIIDLQVVPETVEDLQKLIRPNLPWAEDHFQERVSGVPLNPGEQYKNWPWYRGGVEHHKATGQFSHTYMERYWPKWAAEGQEIAGESWPNPGVRQPELGDLNDVVDLLNREPTTRQAYLPVWFPEDGYAAAVASERVPCSLGYHFLYREGTMDCFYPMRSVDFRRYLRDDLYLTARLLQWVCGRVKFDAKPGFLTLWASSCHVFKDEMPSLKREHGTGET